MASAHASASISALFLITACLSGVAPAYANEASDAFQAQLDDASARLPQQAKDDVARLYDLRHNKLAWTEDDADLARQTLKDADKEGLDPRDYRVPAPVDDAGDDVKARIDIALSAAFLRYARDVRQGRVDPRKVYNDVDLPIENFDAAEQLNNALRRRALDRFIDELPPERPEYAFLRDALARLREGPATARIAQIEANMERWRWMPRKPDKRYVEVNAADASLKIMKNGHTVLTSLVVLGRPSWRTPILATDIKAVILNPPWPIPPEIASQEILPKLRQNASYLKAHNMVLVDGPEDDPHGEKIKWRTMRGFPYELQQVPGETNALGAFLMDMPNRFDVYLHDTSSKSLFSKSERYFSHGCVRVEKIAELASFALYGDDDGEISKRDDLPRDQSERMPLSKPLPVYFVYWTAYEGEDGALAFRNDVYGRDARLKSVLGIATASAPKAPAKKTPAKKRTSGVITPSQTAH